MCAVPAKPDASKFPKLKQYNGGEPYFDAITDAHIDMLAQALACDVTRFGTLFMNDLSYAGNPLELPTDNHGAVAHTYNASTVGNNNVTQAGDAATWLPLAKFNKYCYSKVARLMQKLDQLGILDSTIIYVTSDMGNPALHSTRNVPTVLAGGANGKFKMGRRLKMAADCPTTRHVVRRQAHLHAHHQQQDLGLDRASLRRRDRHLRHPTHQSERHRRAQPDDGLKGRLKIAARAAGALALAADATRIAADRVRRAATVHRSTHGHAS